jgi:hypothetical protein
MRKNITEEEWRKMMWIEKYPYIALMVITSEATIIALMILDKLLAH